MTARATRLARLLVALAITEAGLATGLSMAEEPDSQAMEEARLALQKEHGGALTTLILGERLEYAEDDGVERLVWDVQGWYGGDFNRLWIKSEGEYDQGAGQLEAGEVQALYSRSISSYFNLQAGARHDFEPRPTRTHAVLGVQGLAPYWFELDTSLFISNKGDVSARFEAEYDILFSQRLIAQPRVELEFAAQEVPEIGVGSGLSSVEAELRLRYELVREFAPYVGLSWHELIGDTADLARAGGESTSSLSVVVGFRFWY